MGFLKILQNSLENTCATVSFLIKLQPQPCNLRRDSSTLSCEFYEIFKNTFFAEHLRWLLLKYEKPLRVCFYFMFTFSFKFSQTSLIIKEFIKHENKFTRKVFHDRENSENRFSEFSYFMKGFKKYTMNISR